MAHKCAGMYRHRWRKGQVKTMLDSSAGGSSTRRVEVICLALHSPRSRVQSAEGSLCKKTNTVDLADGS